jgi:RNA polymerase sigma-70 factor (ECF subfamily)
VLAVLVYRGAAADTEARAEPFVATASRVYGLAIRIPGSSTRAGEVTPESHLEVWQSAPLLDLDRSSPLAWISAIAQRRAVDRLRPGLESNPCSLSANVSRRVLREPHRGVRSWSAEARQVSDLIEQLDAVERDALELASFDELAPSAPASLTEIMTRLATRRLPEG